MRCVPYYACCGAYFLCEVDEAAILDRNINRDQLPKKTVTDGGYTGIYPDTSKAGVAYHIHPYQLPGIAYFFCIFPADKKALGDLLCNVHGFKLMSSTAERLLYCLERKA